MTTERRVRDGDRDPVHDPGMPLSRHATGPGLLAVPPRAAPGSDAQPPSVSTRPLAAVIERLLHHDLEMEAGG